ncbi:predicted protein [Botrytis cinerea T4]|uniref:Uncharacterized protein n=1 Tax=Botryotinia fuckeliana (strain T4) TaxID=999810 RepID=G2YU82_BOTF4|nr:predicted protein [Botrytis cinerea T4]
MRQTADLEPNPTNYLLCSCLELVYSQRYSAAGVFSGRPSCSRRKAFGRNDLNCSLPITE